MTFVERMIGAARLDARVYEEIEADRGATVQAALVVVLASAAGSLAVGASPQGFVIRAIAELIGWVVWAWLIYFIGTRWLPDAATRSDTGELLRVVGFAASPALLRVVAIVPVLNALVMAVTAVWTLVAVVIAARQALDYTSTARAVGVCIIGWLVQVAIFVLVGLVTSRPAW